jgi:NADH-quinone oxidoreductase subunit F
VNAAEQEGVKLLVLSAPHRILGDAQGKVKGLEIAKTRLGEYDPSGRRKPVATGEVVRLDCDTVILAVGETVDKDFARASGLTLSESGTIVADRYSMLTSRPKFYAGGDLITGASNVSNAMGYGKKAARKIDEHLMGVKRFWPMFGGFEYSMAVPEKPSESRRHRSAELDPAVRRTIDDEVVLGFNESEAVDECDRCLRCDVRG